jgi:hypothetical protein
MAINFPNSPILNEQYTYDNKTWEWNGTYWEVYSALTSYITSAYTVGDGISNISGVTGGNITLKSFSGVNITIVDGGDKLTFSGSPQQNVSGLYLPLSGGTVTGNTIFTSGLTASTLTSNGSITASTSIARGNYLQPTLVAAANNDVLVGLEINPTFTNGAFTGVKNNWINLVGNASINFTNQVYLKRGDVDVLFASSVETQLKTVSSSAPLKFFVGSTSQYAQFFATTGNLLLQNGGTFTDAGFRLDVNGTTRVQGEANVSFLTLAGNTAVNNSGSVMILGASGAWSAVRVPRYFETTGTISASTSIARGTYLNQTLVATANGDTLVALDIQPTFTTGGFTGTTSAGLRVRNSTNTGNALYVDAIGNATLGASLGVGTLYGQANINLSSGSGNLLLQTNFAVNTGLVMFNSTRNVVIQNGGTFTDSGFRLDVNGTARIQGETTIGDGTNSVIRANSTSAGSFNTIQLIANTSNNSTMFDVRPNGTSTDLTGFYLRDSSTAAVGSNIVILGRGNATLPSTGVSYYGAIIANNANANSLHLGFLVSSVSLGRIEAVRIWNSGNVSIQNGGTFTDSGHRLDVSGTTMLRGIVYGVGATGIPIQLLTTAGTGTAVIGGNAFTPLRFQGQNIQILIGSTQYGYFHATTGNLTLQNGGTFTDSGFRLDVVGSDARINGVRIGLGGGNLTTNTAVGDNALNANTTGTNNVSLGFYSLQLNTTGIGNTSLGFASLYSLSGGGGNNVSIGRESARYIADGTTTLNNSSASIFIGTYTKALANSQSNQIVIGYDAIGLGSNSVVLGNSGITKTALQGNILIGKTTDSGQKLQVSGDTLISGGLTANTISATVKMFDIEHPTKDGLRLRHGNLEGPENGVYFRGTIVNQKEIILPDYWEGLVDESSITVSLTPIGFFQSLFVVSKSNKKIIIDNNEDKNHFDFVIYGERKDINKLIIEYKK